MTLIVGIKLLKGVLIVSDTRELDENTNEITSELRRKITLVTPRTLIAGSGAESSFYVSKILRDCLYNNHMNLSSIDIQKDILDIYERVNNLHRKNHPLKHPVGELLVAEFNQETKDFNLLHQSGIMGFTEFNTFNRVKDIEAIGSNKEIRSFVKEKISNLLSGIDNDQLKERYIFGYIIKEVHKIFKNLEVEGIGKNVYCMHLTEENNKFFVNSAFLNPAQKIYPINPEDDGTYIHLPKDKI